MVVKDELELHGITWAAADKIEYNIIGKFKTINIKTPGYYIVRWTGNEYTIQ